MPSEDDELTDEELHDQLHRHESQDGPPRFKRCEPGDPHQCKGISVRGGDQCVFIADRLPNGTFSDYCTLHLSHRQAYSMKKKARKLYDVARYRSRIDRMVDAEDGAYLDEELGVLRMTLEALLQRYEDVELVTQSGQISALVSGIERVLTTNKKLKSQVGQLMARATVDRLCDSLVGVMTKYCSPELLDQLSQDVAGVVAAAVSDATKDL